MKNRFEQVPGSLRRAGYDRATSLPGAFGTDTDWSGRAIEPFEQAVDEVKRVPLRVRQRLGSRDRAPGPLASPGLEGTIRDFYPYLGRRPGGAARTRDTAPEDRL